MVIYWPNQPSIDLNFAVANLFVQTYQKLSFSLSNRTEIYLPIDLLNKYTKQKLFTETLIELEILILNIIELNLSTKDINKIYNQIVYDFIHKTMKKFISELELTTEEYQINTYSNYNKLFFHEHSSNIKNLFLYLIFGSSSIDNYTFPFHKLQTPFYHVKALFENLIIQISNIIIFNMLENCTSLQEISKVLTTSRISHFKYKSIREISNFRNLLISYNWIELYINYPQNIYCSQYKIWLLSSKGLIYKRIYINRVHEYFQLSHIQLSSTLYLEIQDFIIPQINVLITLLGKFFIYLLNITISKSLKTCFNRIVNQFEKNKK